jgi:HlyD family secretion protein
MNYETTISNTLNAQDTPETEPAVVRNPRRWIFIALALLAIAMAAGAAYYFMGSQGDGKPVVADKKTDDKKTSAQAVTVVSPGNDTVERSIKTTATLAARNEIPVGVVGEGGQVLQVFVDAGDWVKQGQVVVTVDRAVQNQQAASLSAQISVARADLQLAQNELSRALKLVDRGFISKADVDRKIAARDSANARVNVAKAQLSEAQARNSRLDIRSPVSGYVLERKVEPGQTISGGSGILFRIAKDGQMEAQALLGETDLAAVSNGISATVTPVGADKSFTGQIWQVAPMIDPASRQGIARIALPFDRALRPGGFASVQISAGSSAAPVLPESAVQNDKEGSFVYIVGGDNKVARRAVKTGAVSANGLAITEGLNGTELVVLFAGSFLNPGELVKPQLQVKKPAQ